MFGTFVCAGHSAAAVAAVRAAVPFDVKSELFSVSQTRGAVVCRYLGDGTEASACRIRGGLGSAAATSLRAPSEPTANLADLIKSARHKDARMELTPREKDKLLIFTAGLLA